MERDPPQPPLLTLRQLTFILKDTLASATALTEKGEIVRTSSQAMQRGWISLKSPMLE